MGLITAKLRPEPRQRERSEWESPLTGIVTYDERTETTQGGAARRVPGASFASLPSLACG